MVSDVSPVLLQDPEVSTAWVTSVRGWRAAAAAWPRCGMTGSCLSPARTPHRWPGWRTASCRRGGSSAGLVTDWSHLWVSNCQSCILMEEYKFHIYIFQFYPTLTPSTETGADSNSTWTPTWSWSPDMCRGLLSVDLQ